MKTEILNLTYASSLTDLCEINSSFDSGILRIAYTGDNRNGNVVELAAKATKLNVVASATDSTTTVGKIIDVEIAGRYTYYVIKVD